MSNPSSTTFSFHVHGNGVPNADCGTYPNINISFKIVFERTSEDGYQHINWHTEGMSWNSGDQGSGKFGYPYHIYILVNGDRVNSFKEILQKTNTQYTSNWEQYMHPQDASGWFLSTLGTTNVAIYARGSANSGGCYHSNGNKPCYVGNETIQGISCVCLYDVGGVGLPEYTHDYTITYNANGGQNPPPPQTLTDPTNLTLTSQTPTYPVNVVYHNGTVTTQTVYRPFSSWNTNSSGTGDGYGPGGTYHGNSDCILYAIWGSAPFKVTTPLDRKYFVLNYNANGGTVPRAADSFERNRLGYSNTQGASTASYIVGNPNPYFTNGNLDLWPVYTSSITVSASNFPTPSRQGYLFLGWYTSGGTRITTSINLTTDTTTIYAHWQAQPIHKYNGRWSNEGPKVWWYNKTKANQWDNKAPIYKFDGTNWINISEQ